MKLNKSLKTIVNFLEIFIYKKYLFSTSKLCSSSKVGCFGFSGGSSFRVTVPVGCTPAFKYFLN